MKNVTVKVITISSQLLVVTLFLTLVFSGGTNNQNITIGNNNFDKMADKTMTLFKSEELLLSSVDTSVVVPLDDDTKKEEIKEEEVKEEATEEPVVDTTPVISDTPTTPSSSGLFYDREILNTVVGNLTGYGANCYGCSGYTAAGHNLNESMYYDDNELAAASVASQMGICASPASVAVVSMVAMLAGTTHPLGVVQILMVSIPATFCGVLVTSLIWVWC